MSHRGKHFEDADAQSIEGVDVGLLTAKEKQLATSRFWRRLQAESMQWCQQY